MSSHNTAIRRQGYKFRLEPKPKHLDHLNRSLGANRFVWNKLLAMNLSRLQNGHSLLWYQEFGTRGILGIYAGEDVKTIKAFVFETHQYCQAHIATHFKRTHSYSS